MELRNCQNLTTVSRNENIEKYTTTQVLDFLLIAMRTQIYLKRRELHKKVGSVIRKMMTKAKELTKTFFRRL